MLVKKNVMLFMIYTNIDNYHIMFMSNFFFVNCLAGYTKHDKKTIIAVYITKSRNYLNDNHHNLHDHPVGARS